MKIYKPFIYLLLSILVIGCNNNKNNLGGVVTGHPEATKIGIKVLENGGNAIDASIAVQLALAVCLPNAGNIGGGGFMVYRIKNGDSHTLDFREKAPKKASKNMYLDINGEVVDSLSTHGHMAIGIPGTIDGIFKAHEKFGSLDITILFNYAIELASIGFPITERQATAFNYFQSDFKQFNPNNKYLQSNNWKVGDTLKQLDLAHTLEIIRDNGRSGFYEGEIAQSIVNTTQENGIISLSDLKDYEAIWRDPITLQFGNYTLISMPPPSSGGIALSQLFLMLNNLEIEKFKHNSLDYIHILSEIEKRAYADRSMYLGDMDYYPVPINKLLDLTYNQNRAKQINLNKATPSDSISYGKFEFQESEETTHFSIIDGDGMRCL